MSSHVKTGQPIPDELIARLRGARNHMVATGMLRQLHFAYTDMLLHASPLSAKRPPAASAVDDGSANSGDTTHACGFDPFSLERQVALSGYSLLPPLPSDRFLCSFNHIFSGGYSAGYYSYKWAEVMAADAFAAFEESGLAAGAGSSSAGVGTEDAAAPVGAAASSSPHALEQHEAALRSPAVVATGKRFRETVLAMGGSEHPSEVFRKFRGRAPDENALLKLYGLQ